jgi:glycosyltransferase involved in cell wall biosynthesis
MPRAYALLSTYPPTQCGLATFSAALLTHLPEPDDHVAVVRVLDEPTLRSPRAVVHDLVNGSPASAAAAVNVLNGFDVAIVQHEYGIYGGPDGHDIIPLLAALRVPSIVVLHTVLSHPTPHQRMIIDEVVAAAGAVVTMTRTARSRLLDIYGASPEKVSVIPHGATDYRAAASPDGYSGQPTVLTWGLLGPGKGIEHAIDAATDVVLLPYDSLEQVTSGVLIEAVAAGTPVVSTCFPHAVDLLGGGAGLLVNRKDPADIASALKRVLTEAGLSARMSSHSADLAPRLLWSAVARSYRELASALIQTTSAVRV